MRIDYFLLPAFATLVFSCGDQTSSTTAVVDAADSTLVGGDVNDGFVDLYDGETFTGWHRYGGGPVGAAWKADDDGGFYLDVSNKDFWAPGEGGDIVTDESYDNYELQLEWKIAPCGNSGVIYNVTESEANGASYMTGPEMQVLDNSCHPDAKIAKHKAGDLYDMIQGDTTSVKPAGQWNQARLVVNNGRVQHYLNGTLMASYTNSGKEWEDMIADSKFKDMKDFGKTTGGQIALQDHGDEVHYRNVRIRDL